MRVDFASKLSCEWEVSSHHEPQPVGRRRKVTSIDPAPRLALLFLSILFPLLVCAQEAPATCYERSGYTETPRLAQTMEDCRKLAAASPWIKVTSFGRSPQGRELPLVIVSKEADFDPRSVRSHGKAVLMIEAGIHPGEPEGKDAGLLFLRDLAVTKKYAHLLDRITVLFIPVFNVDGHERFSAFNRINQNGPKEMGWRVTSTNLNLNRDFLKADAPEMQAWLKLYREWLPDFFMDCHTTDGADYQYVMTYGVELDSTTEPGQKQWLKDVYLAGFRQRMEQQGMPVFPYVSFRRWHDPRSGLVGGASGPMFSTGYQAAQNRPAILLETHMLKPYKQRVDATYASIRNTAEILYEQRDVLLKLNREADAFASSAAFRSQPMPLSFRPAEDPEIVSFRGFEYTAEKSDLTGGNWFRYDRSKPTVFQIPWYNKLKVSASAKLPEAYIIPAEWTEVIARLDFHGIRYTRLQTAQKLPVASYRFEQVRFASRPRESHAPIESLDLKEITEERTFPAGSAVVPTNQRTARLIAHLLEPASQDSLLKWGFFNAIFEQKEYGESYVLEGLAREIIAKDPALKAEFEKKKAEDKEFAADQEAMLNWFYLRSPYRDERLNVYPVGRILDAELAIKLSQQLEKHEPGR